MAYSLLVHTSAGSPDSFAVTTSAIDTTGADLIIVSAGWFGNVSPFNITDSKGNSWTALTQQTEGSGVRARLWYVQNPTVGSGHTFTTDMSGGVGYPSIDVTAWSGSVSTPFDVENGNTGNASTIQPGSITPSVDNCLVVTGLSFDNNSGGAVSIDSGFTIAETVAYESTHHEGSALAYKIQTTAGAVNPTWNITTSAPIAATIAAFKAAAGAAEILMAQAVL